MDAYGTGHACRVPAAAPQSAALLPERARARNPQAIDTDHLARMSFGDEKLECEILALFDRQAAMLVARMANEEPRVIAALAHTLTGSACGIGAWQLAAAAQALERAAARRDPGRLSSALRHLSLAVSHAQAAIAQLTTARAR